MRRGRRIQMARQLKPTGLQATVREEKREKAISTQQTKTIKEAPRPKMGFVGGSRRRRGVRGIVYTGSAPERGNDGTFTQTPEWLAKEAQAKAQYESAKALAE